MKINNLKSVLASKAITARKLSEHLDVLPSQVSQWSSGRACSDENARRIAAFLGVTVQELCGPAPVSGNQSHSTGNAMDDAFAVAKAIGETLANLNVPIDALDSLPYEFAAHDARDMSRMTLASVFVSAFRRASNERNRALSAAGADDDRSGALPRAHGGDRYTVTASGDNGQAIGNVQGDVNPKSPRAKRK